MGSRVLLLLFAALLFACDAQVSSFVGGLSSGSATLPSDLDPGGSPTPTPTPITNTSPINFGVNGIASLNLGSQAFLTPEFMAQQSDGKIVVYQHSYASSSATTPTLFRYNTDGSLDLTFGTAGAVLAQIPNSSFNNISAFGVGSSGIFLGYKDQTDASHCVIVKYKLDGTIDTSWGTAGYANFDRASNTYIQSIAVQADGKVVAAGVNYSGTPYAWYMKRYNTDGSLDASFGTAGEVVYGSIYMSSGDLKIQSDGKILLAGTIGSWSPAFAMARFLSDGTLDSSTFATASGGLFSGFSGSSTNVRGVQQLSNGQYMILGTQYDGANLDPVAIRVNADGTLDTTFASSGILTVPGIGNNAAFLAVTEESGGKYYFYGGTNSDPISYHTDTSGVADASYGTGGLKTTSNFSFTVYTWYSVLVSGADVFYLGAGRGGSPPSDSCTVSKMDHSLNLQTSYGVLGHAASSFGPAFGQVTKTIPTADHKYLVLGDLDSSSPAYAYVERLNADGTLDTSFNGVGYRTRIDRTSTYESSQDMALLPDGKIVVLTWVTGVDFAITKLNADGTLDASFGSSGSQEYTLTGVNFWLEFFNVDSNGKIMIAGQDGSGGYDLLFYKYNSDGTPDMTFGTSGLSRVTPLGGGGNITPMFAAFEPDGKYVVVAEDFVPATEPDSFSMRINTDGTLDTAYNGTGYQVFDLGSDSDETPQGLVIGPTGKIYVLAYTDYPPNYDDEATIYALKTDGTLDTTFGGTGIVRTGSNFWVDTNAWQRPALAQDSNGNLVAFGLDASNNMALQAWDLTGAPLANFGTGGVIALDANTWSYRYFKSFFVDYDGTFKISFEYDYRAVVRVQPTGHIQ